MKIYLLIVIMALGMTGCSRLTPYFPDKEKDYQLSEEIPPLHVPRRLDQSAIEVAPSMHNAVAVDNQPSTATITDRPAIDDAPVQQSDLLGAVKLVEYAGGLKRIQIAEPIERAWPIVGKAISRKSLEVVLRDQEQKLYAVHYDPEEKLIPDGSLVDEVMFFFGKRRSNEREYHIQLIPAGSKTEVVILDAYKNPLLHGPGMDLLNLLLKEIRADLLN